MSRCVRLVPPDCDSHLMRNLKMLLPTAEHGYQGTRLPYWYLVAITVESTGHSVVHVFASDRAPSIAGMGIGFAGGDNIVAVFAQWGWSQLLLALVGWVIIAGYWCLVPFALLLQDWGGRMLVGGIKPLSSTHHHPAKSGTSFSYHSPSPPSGSPCRATTNPTTSRHPPRASGDGWLHPVTPGGPWVSEPVRRRALGTVSSGFEECGALDEGLTGLRVGHSTCADPGGSESAVFLRG